MAASCRCRLQFGYVVHYAGSARPVFGRHIIVWMGRWGTGNCHAGLDQCRICFVLWVCILVVAAAYVFSCTSTGSASVRCAVIWHDAGIIRLWVAAFKDAHAPVPTMGHSIAEHLCRTAHSPSRLSMELDQCDNMAGMDRRASVPQTRAGVSVALWRAVCRHLFRYAVRVVAWQPAADTQCLFAGLSVGRHGFTNRLPAHRHIAACALQRLGFGIFAVADACSASNSLVLFACPLRIFSYFGCLDLDCLEEQRKKVFSSGVSKAGGCVAGAGGGARMVSLCSMHLYRYTISVFTVY